MLLAWIALRPGNFLGKTSFVEEYFILSLTGQLSEILKEKSEQLKEPND